MIIIAFFAILILGGYIADKVLVDKDGKIKDLRTSDFTNSSSAKFTKHLEAACVLAFIGTMTAIQGFSDISSKNPTGVQEIGLALIGFGAFVNLLISAWHYSDLDGEKIAASKPSGKFGWPMICVGGMLMLFTCIATNNYSIFLRILLAPTLRLE